MINKNINEIVKIGFTDRDPYTRADEISSSTGVPGKWEVIQYWITEDGKFHEQNIHKKLQKYRLDKEFFKIDEVEAKKKIDQYFNNFEKKLLKLKSISSSVSISQDIDTQILAAVQKKWDAISNLEYDKSIKEAEIITGEDFKRLQTEKSDFNPMFWFTVLLPFIAIPIYFIGLLFGIDIFDSANSDPLHARKMHFDSVRQSIYEKNKSNFFEENID